MSRVQRQTGSEAAAVGRARKAAARDKPSEAAGAAAPDAELRQAVGNKALLQLLGGHAGESAERQAEEVATAIGREPAADSLQPPIPLSPPVVQGAPRSPGEPLAPSIRASLEPRFGRELDTVRVHTGSEATAEAYALGARAFTQGRDVVFGAGRYVPETREGLGLLGHELTHVVQQSDAGAAALQRAPDPAAATSAPKASSLPETMEIGASELISAQSPKLAVFAKKVLTLLGSSPAGTIHVTCYWSPGADIARTEAAMRAGVARNALVALGLPADKVKADAFDATLLSPPAPPSGSVLIAFSPQPLNLGLPKHRFSMLDPAETPVGIQGSLGWTKAEAEAFKTAPSTKNFGTPEQGTMGDFVKAFFSLKPVKEAINNVVTKGIEVFQDLSTTDKVFTVYTAITLGTGIVGAIASNPDASKKALDFLNGKQFPVPGVEGLEIQIFTKDGLGGAVQIDLMKFFWKRNEEKKRKQGRSL